MGWLGYSPVFVEDSAEDLLPPDWGVEGAGLEYSMQRLTCGPCVPVGHG